jgi:hypothetical protein
MIEDMTIRKLRPKTQAGYIRAVIHPLELEVGLGFT